MVELGDVRIMGRRWLVWPTTLILAGLVACQTPPATSPEAGLNSSPAVAVSSQAAATVQLRILPAAALHTLAGAKTFANIHHFSVDLVRKPDMTVVDSRPNVTPNSELGTAVTFSNVTTGFTYVLKVDALDASSVSIAKNSPVTSSDIVVTAATTYSPTVNVALQDGLGASLSFSFTAPTYFTPTNYLVWLTNATTGAVVSSYKSTTATPSVSTLPDGNYVAWAAAVNDTSRVMTPVLRLGAVTVSGDAVTTPVGGTVSATFPTAVAKVAEDSNWDISAIAADSSGAVYGLDANTGNLFKVPTVGATPIAIMGNGTPGSAPGDGSVSANSSVFSPSFASGPNSVANGLVVRENGDVFLGDGSNNKLRFIPSASGVGFYGFGSFIANRVYSLASTSAVDEGPQGVAVDAAGTVFYTDSKKVKQLITGSSTPMDIGVAFPSAVAGLSLDSLGNLYATAGTTGYIWVQQAGKYFGANMSVTGSWQQLTALTAATYRQCALGPAGNLYVVDKGGLNIYCLDSIAGTRYRVVGLGSVGITLQNGNDPLSGSLTGTESVAVDANGILYFTTSTALWRLP